MAANTDRLLIRLDSVRADEKKQVQRPGALAVAEIFGIVGEAERNIHQADFASLIEAYIGADPKLKLKIEQTLRGVFSMPGDYWTYVGAREKDLGKKEAWLEAMHMATSLGWKYVSALYPKEPDGTLIDTKRLAIGASLFYRSGVSGYLGAKTGEVVAFQSFLQMGRLMHNKPQVYGLVSLNTRVNGKDISALATEIMACIEWGELGTPDGMQTFLPTQEDANYIAGTVAGWSKMLGVPSTEGLGGLEIFRTNFKKAIQVADEFGQRFSLVSIRDNVYFKHIWPAMVRRGVLCSLAQGDAFVERPNLATVTMLTPEFSGDCLIIYNPDTAKEKVRKEVMESWWKNYSSGELGWLGLSVPFEWLLGGPLYFASNEQLMEQNGKLRTQLMVVDGFLAKPTKIITDTTDDQKVFGGLAVTEITFKPDITTLSYGVEMACTNGTRVRFKVNESNWNIAWNEDDLELTTLRSRLLFERVVLGYLAQQLDRRSANGKRAEGNFDHNLETEGGNGVFAMRINHMGWENKQSTKGNGKRVLIDDISHQRLGLPVEQFDQVFRKVQLGDMDLLTVKQVYGVQVANAIVHYETKLMGQNRPEKPVFNLSTGKLESANLDTIRIRISDKDELARSGRLPTYSLSVILPERLPDATTETIIVRSPQVARRIIDESNTA